MLVKTKAIVLHSIKLGESKTIVDMLTERQGRVSFVCRIASSGKAKIKKQFSSLSRCSNWSMTRGPAGRSATSATSAFSRLSARCLSMLSSSR